MREGDTAAVVGRLSAAYRRHCEAKRVRPPNATRLAAMVGLLLAHPRLTERTIGHAWATDAAGMPVWNWSRGTNLTAKNVLATLARHGTGGARMSPGVCSPPPAHEAVDALTQTRQVTPEELGCWMERYTPSFLRGRGSS